MLMTIEVLSVTILHNETVVQAPWPSLQAQQTGQQQGEKVNLSKAAQMVSGGAFCLAIKRTCNPSMANQRGLQVLNRAQAASIQQSVARPQFISTLNKLLPVNCNRIRYTANVSCNW